MSDNRLGAFPHNNVSNPSLFFTQCVHRDSNLEMEWLWAAEQVAETQEKRYCLLRALYINPRSQEALSQMRRLTVQANAPGAVAYSGKAQRALRLPLQLLALAARLRTQPAK